MTYFVTLSESFTTHPKIVALSDRAFRLHVCGIVYASHHRTDGIIPAAAVRHMVPGHRKALGELCDRLLWVPLDNARYYEIHDFLEWNRSRAEIDKLAAARASAARKRWEK